MLPVCVHCSRHKASSGGIQNTPRSAHSTHMERTLDANRRAHSMPSPRKMLGVRLSGLQSLNLGPQISLHDLNLGQKYPNTLRPGKTSLNCHFGAEFVLAAPKKSWNSAGKSRNCPSKKPQLPRFRNRSFQDAAKKLVSTIYARDS